MSVAISTSSAELVQGQVTPTVYNLVSFAANTEYSQALPVGCKGFKIKPLVKCTMKIGFNSGDTNTNPFTIPPCCSYTEHNAVNPASIYFQTSVGSVIVELIVYY